MKTVPFVFKMDSDLMPSVKNMWMRIRYDVPTKCLDQTLMKIETHAK